MSTEGGDVVSAHEDLVTYWQRQAMTARARGNWTAERHALDQIILIERGDRPVGGAPE